MSANAFDNSACRYVNIAYQIMFDKNRLIHKWLEMIEENTVMIINILSLAILR